MANMEFLSANLLATTDSVAVDSGTDLVYAAFDGNRNSQFSTLGYSSDTSTIFSISLSAASVISHVLIQNHNLKQFRVFYDGVTANSLYTTSTNSATSTYIEVASVTVSSIQIQMDAATAADTEKAVGEIVIAEEQLVFERNPSVTDFRPKLYRKQVIHKMPDGGVSVYNIREKYQNSLKWKFVTTTFYTGLKTLFDAGNPLVFVPFPTATSWDGEAFEIVWTGDFDFKHSTNDKDQGFTGSLALKQTAST